MSRKSLSVATILYFILASVAVMPAAAQPPGCEVVKAEDVSSEARKVATGLITATQSSFSETFTGGQAVWVELKNGNVHLTPVVVRFVDKVVEPRRETRIACQSLVTVPPQGTVFVKYGVFGTRITYSAEVSLPDEPPIDSAVINITIRALPGE